METLLRKLPLEEPEAADQYHILQLPYGGEGFAVKPEAINRTSAFLREEVERVGTVPPVVVLREDVGVGVLGAVVRFLMLFEEEAWGGGEWVRKPLGEMWVEELPAREGSPSPFKEYVNEVLLGDPVDPYEHILNVLKLASLLSIPRLQEIASATLLTRLRAEPDVISAVLGDPKEYEAAPKLTKAWLARREEVYEEQHTHKKA